MPRTQGGRRRCGRGIRAKSWPSHITRSRANVNCSLKLGINHIDEMIVDDLMVDDPCLKSQTLTVRMSLRAGDMCHNSPHGWDSRPPTKGSPSLHPRISECVEVGSDASHHSSPVVSTRKVTVGHESYHSERCGVHVQKHGSRVQELGEEKKAKSKGNEGRDRI